MAKVKMRLHSDVDNLGEPVENYLQQIADATEGYFSYVLGCEEKREEHYKQAMLANAQLLAELTRVRNKLA